MTGRTLTGPTSRWSLFGQTLHWLSAGLILFMLGLGLTMVEAVTDQGARFDLYQRHKSVGVLVFLVMAIRVLWRIGARSPALPETMPRWEKIASHISHLALYLLTFGMLISGYAMVSSSPLPLPIELPGGFLVPNLIAPDFMLSQSMRTLHHRLAWVLLALVALHIAAAFKHHFYDRDGVLLRMLPGRRGGAMAALPLQSSRNDDTAR